VLDTGAALPAAADPQPARFAAHGLFLFLKQSSSKGVEMSKPIVTTTLAALALAFSAGLAAAPPAKRLVDINSASRAQLKKLPGIGEAEAERIVAGRPYLSKAELATKHAIPTGKYLQIKTLIVAKQKGQPNAKKS